MFMLFFKAMADVPDPKLEESGQTEAEDLEEIAAQTPSRDVDGTVIINGEGEEKTPRYRANIPYVVIVQGPRSGSRFPLDKEGNIIGRSPNCVVRLDDQSVSRQHAEINRVPGGWAVKDLGSKNGTIVNRSPVTEQVIIGHKDFVKVGIYLLRLITQEVSIAEEMTLPADMVVEDSTALTDVGALAEPSAAAKTEEADDEVSEPSGESLPPVQGLYSRYRKYLAPAILALVIAITAVYLAQKFIGPSEKPEKKEAVEAKDDGPKALPGVIQQPPRISPTLMPTQPGVQPRPLVPVAPPTTPGVAKIPVFLDFMSSPLPATVMFQGKELGRTPLRINMGLEPNKAFEAEGVFVMPDVNERYVQKINFMVDPRTAVIPLLFRGPIGMIKVNELPRDVQFYLEGKFEYDRFSERPVKISEIVLRKPIYLPFGEYTVELRRARQLGASQTYVQDIVYRRQFSIAAENPTFVLTITVEDLSAFPVDVKSVPSNAAVFIDGKRVGKTPYKGMFPLGEHRMSIKKEGFFEYTEELKVDINTPYATTVTLKTSKAGEYLNAAQAAMNREMYQDAIRELAEALNSNPAPVETAKANLMLGKAFFALNDVQRAMSYYQLAQKHEDYKHAAMLGLVRGYAALNQTSVALPLLVEVMLNATDDQLKREANDVFLKISPFKSVIYVYTEPEGAKITVNDKKIGQVTPVILHDISLGTYKLHIEKPGYLPKDLRLTLSVNEFNPVVVKLTPIPE